MTRWEGPMVRFLVRTATSVLSSAALTSLLAGSVVAPTRAQAPGGIAPDDSGIAPQNRELGLEPSDLRELVEHYQEDLRILSRRYDAPGSAERRERMRSFVDEWQDRLGTIDAESLNLEGWIDWVLMTSELEARSDALDLEEQRWAEVSELMPYADDLFGLHEQRRERFRPDAAAVAAQLDALEDVVEETKKAVERGVEAERKKERESEESKSSDKTSKSQGSASKESASKERASKESESSETGSDGDEADEPKLVASKTAAHRTARYTEQLQALVKGWFEYSDGYDPLFSWWVGDPYRKLDEGLKGYVEFLRKEVLEIKEDEDAPIVGDPVGREALLEQLEQAMIAYSPEELIAIAEKELAWCEEEMRRAAREMGFGDDWKAALEKVKSLHVGPGEQPDMVRDLAYEATEFVESRGLVTVPALAKEVWRMEMMSPERQKMSPFFLGGEAIIVSFPTDTMTHEEKLMSMRGNNRHFSRATVHHELIPGHHLQGFMTRRHNSHRSLFRTPFWGEGWALYWEMRLWDLDFPESPEDRIGMLFWRMHRCARVIWSLGFHLGNTSPDEAVEFLVERVGHERENALAEVRRSFEGTYSPLYQAAYLIGGIQFYALHEELVGGGVMSERAFHDAILRGGRMPVAMVRARLGATPRGGNPGSWRFVGDPLP